MKLEVYHATQGRDRTHPEHSEFNCDNYLAVWPNWPRRDHFVAAVADGMGGRSLEERAKIALASKKAIELFRKNIRGKPISDAVDYTLSDYVMSGCEEDTTLTAIAIKDGKLSVAQLGDSLAYLIRSEKNSDRIYQLVDVQDGRRLIQLVFKKHPSEITLDDLLSIMHQQDNRSMILKSCLIEVGGNFYNMLTKDKHNLNKFGRINIMEAINPMEARSQMEAINPMEARSQMESIKAILKKYLRRRTFDIGVYGRLSPEIRMQLTVDLIRLAYVFWDKPGLMSNPYWRRMYSELCQDGGEIGGFSASLPRGLVRRVVKGSDKNRYLPLANGDIVVVMSDGVIENILENYMPNDIIDNPTRDWDYAYGLYNRAAQRLISLIKEYGIKDAIDKVTKPRVRQDDATIVVIKYLGN